MTAASLLLAPAAGADETPSGTSAPAGSSEPGSVGPSAPAGGTALDEGSRSAIFGLQPAGAAGVDGRAFFSFGATPGAKVNDHVALVNIGVEPLALSLYAADAIPDADGKIAFRTQGEPSSDTGAWVTIGFETPQITVPPRDAAGQPGVVVVPFSMLIPPQASPGDHVGAIVASLRTTGTSPSGQTLNLDQRVAMRIYTRVSGQAAPALAVEHLAVDYNGTANPVGRGSAEVSYTVRNTGNIVLQGSQTVTLSGPAFSRQDAGALADLPALLPGASTQVHLQIADVLPMIWLTADVEIVPHATPTNPQDVMPAPFTTSANTRAVPWTLLGVLILLGVAAWRSATVIRRRSGAGSHRAAAAA